jgi:hypothetical protein
MTGSDRYPVAALATLIVLQVTMLSALYAGIRPHPPEATPLFGMAPFIGASVSIALAAVIVGPGTTAIGRALSLLAAVSALVSFGPQKYLDPQIGQIWPAVILGQLAALWIILLALRASRTRVPSGATNVALEAQ